MMKIKHPEISIIMPVFNRKSVILRACRSVDSQTFENYELVIVDDGSTDGLEDIIIPEVLKRENWRYMKHKNRKVAWTRNIGIQAALGEYITFLDSDDEYLPEHLQRRIDFLRANPEVDLIHGGVQLIGPEETFWVKDAENPDKLIHLNDCCVGATLFAPKSLFIEEGGFPIVAYSPEYHFLKKIEKKYRIEKVDFPTYVYHTSGEDRICFRIA